MFKIIQKLATAPPTGLHSHVAPLNEISPSSMKHLSNQSKISIEISYFGFIMGGLYRGQVLL